MDYRNALDQISEIHRHVSQNEVYRGYKSVPVAATGGVAAIAALAQPSLVGDPTTHPGAFAALWLGAAAVNVVITAIGLWTAWRRNDARHQRQTARMLGQFAPCVAAGALITIAFLGPAPDAERARWLPGLWATLCGLGYFASRPNMPRTIGWVALWYMAAGGALLAWASREGNPLHPWGMGLTFGVGQLCCAITLYWNLERNGNGGKKIELD